MLAFSVTLDGTRMSSSHVEECPDIGPACEKSPAPRPYNHDLVNWAYGATIDAQYGISRFLGLSLSLPVRAVTTQVKYTTLDGAPYDPDPPDVHHRNRTLTGLGDPSFTLSFGRRFDRLSFAIRAGSLLPFGKTLDEDPFIAGREGRPHEHVQFGVGTLRPTFGSSLGYDLGSIGFDAWSIGILSLATNSIGYRSGQRLAVGARAWFSVAKVTLGVGSEVSHETTETWAGLGPSEGNLGRTDVVALLSARTPIGEKSGLFCSVRVPLYVNAVGAQLSYPAYVQLGVATSFGP
ncbi:MAG: hypothetical protein ACXWVM_24885 [Polyangiales bacterium]